MCATVYIYMIFMNDPFKQKLLSKFKKKGDCNDANRKNLSGNFQETPNN